MSNEHRRQKKLAKLKAKRADKKADVTRSSQSNHRLLLKQVETCPIHEALIPIDLADIGMGQLVLSRKLPDGRLACAVILLDTCFMGVKNSFFRVEYPSRYNAITRQMGQDHPFRHASAEEFVKIVLGAVAYAEQFGLHPDADFADCRHVLANIDPTAFPGDFIYGRDGKPFYVRGPSDSLGRANELANLVKAAGGDYLIRLKPEEESRVGHPNEPAST